MVIFITFGSSSTTDSVTMDWLTFISNTIDSLAWPVVAMVLGLVFRKSVVDLIPALRKLKAGPLEAEFELATKQVLANAAEANAQSNPTDEASSPGSHSDDKKIVARLLNARNDPAGVILEGWARVDGELLRLGHQMGLLVAPVENTQKVYQSVMTSDILPVGTMQLIRELRELRNKVAHVEVQPTSDAAQDYLLAVDRVTELILNYRKNLPNYGPSNR